MEAIFLYSCLFYPVLKLLKVEDFLVFLPQLIREVSTMHSFRCHGGSSGGAGEFTEIFVGVRAIQDSTIRCCGGAQGPPWIGGYAAT